MANTSSAKKQYRKSLRQKLVNINNVSRIKTLIKKIYNLADNNKKEEAAHFFKFVQSAIMKGVKKKVLNLNTASRKVSKLAKKIKP